MNIPKQLKIGGHIVKVDMSEELDNNGESEPCINLIKISKEIAQSQKESTLIHEIFHFLNTTFDHGMNHAFMDSLAEQFYQVLKDNNLLK
ncbi:MAG: hypothetical protein NTX44_09965 [Ignavibacteriales bacterium]|jgi:hypothetical protein|nr:hypothetical protein [Ignavibacteriales bacterium]